MIAALKAWLQANIVSVPRWYEWAPGQSGLAKPYGIIEVGPLFGSVNNIAGGIQVVRLTVVMSPVSWQPVDDACEEIRRKLHNQVLTRPSGERFELRWDQTTDRDHDPVLNAFTKTVVFSVPTRL